jgi:dinuclear metal center YbgI/SA1388 family protein
VTELLVADIAALLEEWYPPSLAEDWDVVGLTLGAPDATVTRIQLAVEPTLAVLDEAARAGADLLITHHPLLLRGVDRVRFDSPKGALIEAMIRARMALLVAHTNADSGVGGVVDCLADALGLSGCEPLAPAAVDVVVDAPAEQRGSELGLGRVGSVARPVSLRDFAGRVARALPATAAGIRVGGDLDRPVRRVAVLAGAGDSLLDAARASGADVYVTSDLRHHPASEALAWPGAPALIDIPHWAAEWLWLPALQRRLSAAVIARGADVSVEVSALVTDPWALHLA